LKLRSSSSIIRGYVQLKFFNQKALSGKFPAQLFIEVLQMTIDKSLKIKAGSAKTRNVLTRPERLQKLIADDRWSEGDKVYGMPKVRVAKLALKKKKKVKEEDEE
jgi:small basic protein (TIGR04137 family)